MSEESVIEIRPHEQVLLVGVLRRSLDEEATRCLVDEVLTAAAGKPGVPIVLDLSEVKFAPSVAIGALVQLSKSFKLDQRRIALIGVQRRVNEVIRVTQLHHILEIHHTLDQVIDAPPPNAR